MRPSASCLLHVPGRNLHRHELLVRPDVLDDDDCSDVPRANHTQRAAGRDSKPSASCLPAPRMSEGLLPTFPTPSPRLHSLGHPNPSNQDDPCSSLPPRKTAGTVTHSPQSTPQPRRALPPTWRISGSRSPWGWRGVG